MMTRFRANMDDWDPLFLNELGRTRPVIIFNNAGVATSSGEVPRTIKGAADHAATLCKALGIETVDILGWSMAGFTAQVMAIEYPQLVRQVVLIGTGPGASPETPPPNRPEVFEVATRPTVTDTIWQEEDHEYLFFAPGSRVSAAAVRASLGRIREREAKGLESPTTQRVMERQSEAIQGFWFKGEGNYFARLKDLRQPTMILNGDRDAFFNVMAQALLYREIPNARLGIYPMAGHGPHHQYPRQVAAVVSDFLNEKPILARR
ncbi:MAG: alpha/beta hydrolase [Myxococcota bacterium]